MPGSMDSTGHNTLKDFLSIAKASSEIIIKVPTLKFQAAFHLQNLMPASITA
jgi:hypothetical protein